MDGNEGDPRIVVVTVSEYFYIPRFLWRVLESNEFDVVGVVTMPPALGTESTPSFVARLVRVFGPRVFVKHGLFYVKYLALDLAYRLLDVGAPYSPRSLADRFDVDYRHVADVNAASTVDYVRSKDPDVLVSVAATQRFEATLLDVPRRCAINIHSSLLPDYRGVSPGFWALLNDEPETGLTVHYMDESIDTGDVILQEPLEIRPDDTLHSLNTRVADRGSEVLLEALERIRDGTADGRPIDPDEGSYYSMPSREDVRAFLRRGNRFY